MGCPSVCSLAEGPKFRQRLWSLVPAYEVSVLGQAYRASASGTGYNALSALHASHLVFPHRYSRLVSIRSG